MSGERTSLFQLLLFIATAACSSLHTNTVRKAEECVRLTVQEHVIFLFRTGTFMYSSSPDLGLDRYSYGKCDSIPGGLELVDRYGDQVTYSIRNTTTGGVGHRVFLVLDEQKRPYYHDEIEVFDVNGVEADGFNQFFIEDGNWGKILVTDRLGYLDTMEIDLSGHEIRSADTVFITTATSMSDIDNSRFMRVRGIRLDMDNRLLICDEQARSVSDERFVAELFKEDSTVEFQIDTIEVDLKVYLRANWADKNYLFRR